jgi:hypothetical protein
MKNNYKLIVIAILISLTASLKAQTAGTFTFTFTDVSQTGYNGGNEHTLVVWIEKQGTGQTCINETTHLASSSTVQTVAAHNGTLFATYLRYCCALNTSDHEPQWRLLNNNSTTATIATGGTSSSTITSYGSNTITWSVPNTVADGVYRVCIEKCWSHGTSAIEQRYFVFTKIGTSFNFTASNNTGLTNDSAFTGISMVWNATLANNQLANDTEMAVIYPNPSKGFFNVDFKTDVKNVKVLNILGQIVYNEDITNQTTTTKKIDLSNLNNGEYIVIVSNDLGQSSYKLILDK